MIAGPRDCHSADVSSAVLRCPYCGQAVNTEPPPLGCSCGHRAMRTAFGWSWGSRPLQTRAARLRMLLRAALDPLENPYSPLVMLTRRKVEAYYRRILGEHRLAAKWRHHFLDGLALPDRPVLLDHGCGRGRVMALASNCGFQAYGQDVTDHPWWSELRQATFQVVPADAQYLPWADEAFDLVTDFSVIGHVADAALEHLSREIFRVLRPGGYWLLWEVNPRGWGARASRRFCGGVHATARLRAAVTAAGFVEHSGWTEGWRSPLWPRGVEFVRGILCAREFDYFEYHDGIASYLPPVRRAMWVLRLEKPMRS
jgi:SAM-dependent methyltransferase